MKKFLALLGIVSVILGMIGIFLPVLPTTPFLLLASYLFLKSSPRLYKWLMGHPRFGPYLKDFTEHRCIPLKAKIISISMLWISLLACAIFVTDKLVPRLLFVGLAIAVTCHILSFKSKR